MSTCDRSIPGAVIMNHKLAPGCAHESLKQVWDTQRPGCIFLGLARRQVAEIDYADSYDRGQPGHAGAGEHAGQEGDGTVALTCIARCEDDHIPSPTLRLSFLLLHSPGF